MDGLKLQEHIGKSLLAQARIITEDKNADPNGRGQTAACGGGFRGIAAQQADEEEEEDPEMRLRPERQVVQGIARSRFDCRNRLLESFV